jgi:hypothetical protein
MHNSGSGQAVNYYFVGLLSACAIYAFVAGGWPERIGAAAYAASVAATHLLLMTHTGRWHSVEVGVFTVDVLVFLAFIILALRADRYWPIWVSALLGLGLLGHLARWAGPEVIPWAYAVILTVWSYPILVIIVIGTFSHRRRLARFGADRSWTSSSTPSDDRQAPGPNG